MVALLKEIVTFLEFSSNFLRGNVCVANESVRGSPRWDIRLEEEVRYSNPLSTVSVFFSNAFRGLTLG